MKPKKTPTFSTTRKPTKVTGWSITSGPKSVVQRETYLFLRPDSARWQFRRPVPKHLHAAVGKREIAASTGTTSFAEAKRVAKKLSADCDKLFATHSAPLSASVSTTSLVLEQPTSRPTTLQRWMIPQLVARYHVAMLSMPKADQPKTVTALKAERILLDEERQQLEDACALQDLSYALDNAENILETEGFDLQLTDPTLMQYFTQQLLFADLAVVKKQIARLYGEDIPEEEMPAAPGENDSWDDYVNHWINVRKPSPKSARDCRKQVVRLRAFTADSSPLELTEDNVRAFAEHLEHKKGLTRSRIKTIFGLLRPMMQKNVENRLAALTANPFGNVKIEVAPGDVYDIQPFEPEYLVKLFDSPVYAEGKRSGKGGKHAAFWLPLLALFCGARLEELGQLYVNDVISQSGRLFLRIAALKHDQGIKNDISGRHVPVHDELLKIGFACYVESVRAAGKERLFPDLTPNQDGVFTAKFSTWFNEYLDTHVVDDRAYNFHSFRHFFEERAGWCRLSNYQIDGILGHQPEGMSKHYGQKKSGRRVFDPMQLAKGMDRFRIDEIDLSPLYGKY